MCVSVCVCPSIGLLNQEYGLPGGQSSKALVAGNRALADTFVHVIRTYFRRLTVGLVRRMSFVDDAFSVLCRVVPIFMCSC